MSPKWLNKSCLNQNEDFSALIVTNKKLFSFKNHQVYVLTKQIAVDVERDLVIGYKQKRVVSHSNI